ILFGQSTTFVGAALGNRLFVGIGLISYSAYLWHQPLFAFARQRLPGHPSDVMFLFLVVLTFLLAYISWRFVEVPFRSRVNVGRRQVFTLAVVGSITLSVVGLWGHISGGYFWA